MEYCNTIAIPIEKDMTFNLGRNIFNEELSVGDLLTIENNNFKLVDNFAGKNNVKFKVTQVQYNKTNKKWWQFWKPKKYKSGYILRCLKV